MSFPVERYHEDRTGKSPANFIAAERKVLGPKAGPFHPIAPIYGPFFYDPDTLQVYVNGNLLVPEIDYWGVNLIADVPTEIPVCELLILKGFNEGDVLTIDYQCYGGRLQNNASAIVDLYNAYLQDNRPIAWTSLRNIPKDFPPAYHMHFLKEVTGWEYVIVAIERLNNALTLQQVPAFDALIDWVNARILEIATEEEIEEMVQSNRVISLSRLIFASRRMNFNSLRVESKDAYVYQSDFVDIVLKATNFNDNELLYWEIDHITTFPWMFTSQSGTIRMDGQDGNIMIPTVANPEAKGTYEFRVKIRRLRADGPMIAQSKKLIMVYTKQWDLDYGALQNGLWTIPRTLNSLLVQQTPSSHFLIPDDVFIKENHAN